MASFVKVVQNVTYASDIRSFVHPFSLNLASFVLAI